MSNKKQSKSPDARSDRFPKPRPTSHPAKLDSSQAKAPINDAYAAAVEQKINEKRPHFDADPAYPNRGQR